MARSIRRLRWNPVNVAHIWHHRVRISEVQEVVDGDYLIESGHSGRIVVVGPTTAGRILAVVLEPEGSGVFFPVTSRPASRTERRRYQDQRGGADQ